ncbi:MAG: hypothetical protein WCO00_14930 [Rhodospirillaceae bacterium]
MQKYAEYAPNAVDRPGLSLPDRQDWLVVPTGRNRDSDLATNSNFDAALKLLGGEGDDVEVHRFRHYMCGWLEIVLVRPETVAASVAEDIESRLERYPLLNEDDVGEREHDAYVENWKSWGAYDFVRCLLKRFPDLSEDEANTLDDADPEVLREFFQDSNSDGDWQEDGSPNVRKSAERVERTDLEHFISTLMMTQDADVPMGPAP